ncbi:MAG: proline iminopeptidase-family hydrolase [Candidatus Geothermincolia bacterium]
MSGTKTEEGFVDFQGFRIFYRIVGEEEGPMRLPLVCLAGGPGVPWGYLSPLEALADGRRVVFYDQLGCGKSDRPGNPDMWTVDLFVEGHEVVMNALGLSNYHLLGQSWGGMLAMEYSLIRPDGVASLVLASSPCSIPQWESETGRLRSRLPVDVQITLSEHEDAGTTDSPEYEEAMMVFYQRHVCRMDPWPDFVAEAFEDINDEIYHTMFGPSEFFVTGTLKEWDITGRLAGISIPTLITTGLHDEATPEIGRTLNDCIAGSRWVLFENSAHCAHAEEAERYASVVGSFLEEVELGLR